MRHYSIETYKKIENERLSRSDRSKEKRYRLAFIALGLLVASLFMLILEGIQ